MLLYCTETANVATPFFSDSANIPLFVSIITFIGTAIVGWISIHNNNKIRTDTKKVIKRGEIVERKKKLENKLDEFYIPLRHYLENSKTLFKIFSKGKPDKFRTLTYLLNKKQIYIDINKAVILDKNDNSILEKIFEIGEKIEKLIYEKSYLIGNDIEFVNSYMPRSGYDDIIFEKDMSLLSLTVSHLVVIRMAYKGDLEGDVSKFEGFVFPNEINIRVKEKIAKLEGLIADCEKEIAKLDGTQK